MSDVDTSITQELQQCRARFLKVIRYLAANVQLAVFLKVRGIKIKGLYVFSWVAFQRRLVFVSLLKKLLCSLLTFRATCVLFAYKCLYIY